MERDGLILRTYHAEVPPRVEYEISDLGLRLAPIFAELNTWSDLNMDEVNAARRRYDASPDRARRHA